jgi:hypothetical protein
MKYFHLTMSNIIFVRYEEDEISIEKTALFSCDGIAPILRRQQENGYFKGGTTNTPGTASF